MGSDKEEKSHENRGKVGRGYLPFSEVGRWLLYVGTEAIRTSTLRVIVSNRVKKIRKICQPATIPHGAVIRERCIEGRDCGRELKAWTAFVLGPSAGWKEGSKRNVVFIGYAEKERKKGAGISTTKERGVKARRPLLFADLRRKGWATQLSSARNLGTRAWRGEMQESGRGEEGCGGGWR